MVVIWKGVFYVRFPSAETAPSMGLAPHFVRASAALAALQGGLVWPFHTAITPSGSPVSAAVTRFCAPCAPNPGPFVATVTGGPADGPFMICRIRTSQRYSGRENGWKS